VGTPSPRGTESTLPGRVSAVRNVVTPFGVRAWPGQPTVRKVQFPGGCGMVQEANAGGRKATGSRDNRAAPSSGRLDNWPDTGFVAWPERELTWTR
jgi:hypothetical protein